MTTLQEKTFDKVILGKEYLDLLGDEIIIVRHEQGLNFNRFIGDNGKVYTDSGTCTDGVSYNLVNCVSEEIDDLSEEEAKEFPLKTCKNLWFPISELKDKYHPKLMIASPELIDGDVNPEGVSIAYFQDDEGWIAVDWDMDNDEPTKVVLKESDVTHFMYCEGPYEKDEYRTAKYPSSVLEE